ncbi:MAG: trypsin-like serine protease [Alphaproteobacteria bacterium]|nr:trypsin-like serine protease [Alphaproteobacteria bacterium]
MIKAWLAAAGNIGSFVTSKDARVALTSAVTILNVNKGVQGAGSGVLIGPRLVLTSNHVLQKKEALYRFDVYSKVGGEQTTIKDIIRFPDSDVAILYLSSDLPGPYAEIEETDVNRNVRVIAPNIKPQLTNNIVQTRNNIKEKYNVEFYLRGRYIKGVDAHQKPSASKGHFSKLAMAFSIPGRHGNSGGGVFNRESGKLISIMNMIGYTRNGDKWVYTNNTYGSSTQFLREAVAQAKAEFGRKYGSRGLEITPK